MARGGPAVRRQSPRNVLHSNRELSFEWQMKRSGLNSTREYEHFILAFMLFFCLYVLIVLT